VADRRVWTVEIAFSEDGGRTRADARLRADGRVLAGWGRSRRNPEDPEVPTVGAELAASRALADLAHQLVNEALDLIETFEPGPEVSRAEGDGAP
jgi:hypothetical protein